MAGRVLRRGDLMIFRVTKCGPHPSTAVGKRRTTHNVVVSGMFYKGRVDISLSTPFPHNFFSLPARPVIGYTTLHPDSQSWTPIRGLDADTPTSARIVAGPAVGRRAAAASCPPPAAHHGRGRSLPRPAARPRMARAAGGRHPVRPRPRPGPGPHPRRLSAFGAAAHAGRTVAA